MRWLFASIVDLISQKEHLGNRYGLLSLYIIMNHILINEYYIQ